MKFLWVNMGKNSLQANAIKRWSPFPAKKEGDSPGPLIWVGLMTYFN